MPKAPPFLEGIINLRGKVIPVLDMRKRFQMPLLDRTDESRILVVEIKEQMLGFLVDKVVGVLRVAPSLVEPAQEAVLTVGPEFMEGLVRLDRRLIILLNLKKLLTFDDAKALPGWDANPSAEGSPRGH
jgi:purine-binding chemotaxis protein CheW